MLAMGLFARWVVRKAISSLVEHEAAAFTDGDFIEEDDQTFNPVSVLRLQVRYEVLRTGLQPDLFENVLHFVNTAGTLPGAPATDVQKGSVESAFDAFWTSARNRCPNHVGLKEYRWYRFSFADPLTGPPTRVTTKTSPIVGGGPVVAPQIAETVTLRTPLRKNWGRIYLPGAAIGTKGLIDTGDVDAIANAFKTFATACDTADLNVVVYSPIKAAVFGVSAIECDDVADVVRRRRPKASTYRKILTS